MADPISTLSILLIEDEPADSKLLQATLRDEIQRGEVIIQTVRKLKMACEELKRFSFTCVLMDLGLPDGMGVEGVLKLREADPHATIIVMTGLDDDRSAQRAIQLGAQEYLVKGRYDGPELLKLLRRAVLRDSRVTRLEDQRQHEFYQAGHDALTGLVNRQLFEDRVRQTFTAAKVMQTHFAVGLFDIEDLRSVGEQHGQAVADALLGRVAQIFAESARESDTTARLGHDEFALLFPYSGTGAEIGQVATRILSRIEALKQIDGKPVSVKASVGIAQYPQHGDTLEILMQNAAIARQQIKSVGGGVLRVGAPLPEAKIQQEQVRVEIDHALGTEQFEVWCQPWLTPSELQPVGVEILLRWQQAKKMLHPDEFLPVAEQSGQIHGLGLSVARRAFDHYRRWREQGLHSGVLALNVSQAELLDSTWLPQFLSIVRDSGLRESDLQIEIRPEALAPATLSFAVGQIATLRDLGMQVVLDQVSGDNASLRMLSTTPLDGFKTSRTLLRGIAAEGMQGESRRTLAGLLGLARGINLPVVVTGVETSDDLFVLNAHNAGLVQGRLFCDPVRAAEWPARLAAGFSTARP